MEIIVEQKGALPHMHRILPGSANFRALPELIGELNPHLKGWVPARCK
jgi:hypothetical protein